MARVPSRPSCLEKRVMSSSGPSAPESFTMAFSGAGARIVFRARHGSVPAVRFAPGAAAARRNIEIAALERPSDVLAGRDPPRSQTTQTGRSGFEKADVQRFGERRASAVLENGRTLAARPFHL